MLRRLFWVLTCMFAGLVTFAFVRTASFVGQPFPGFLVYANGMVSAFGSDRWSGSEAGLEPWDLIEKVDGQPVRTAAEILETVRGAPSGTVFRYHVRRGAFTRIVSIASQEFTFEDFLTEPLPWLLTGTLVAAAGLLLCGVRPDWSTLGFGAFAVALGIGLLRLDLLVSGGGAYVFQAIFPMIPAALLHLALVFPRRPALVSRRPALLALPYAVSAALGLLRGFALFRAPRAWILLDQVAFVYCAAASLVLIGMFLHAAVRSTEAVTRERARVVLLGLIPAVLSVVLGVLQRWATGSPTTTSKMALLGVWVWGASLAYAAAKRNIFEFEIVVRRAITWALVWAVAVAVYGAALAVSVRVLQALGYSAEAMIPVIGVVIALPFIPGLSGALRSIVEARMFPLRARLVEVVEELSGELSALMVTSEVSGRVRGVFADRLGVTRAILYVADGERIVPIETGDSPLPLAVTAVLRELEPGTALSLFEGSGRGGAAYDWMRRHGFVLILPLVVQFRLEGFFALGEASGGRIFHSEDIDALATLASRIAISLANAKAYDRVRELEGRLREENRALREELELDPGFPEIVGRSAPMRAVYRMIEQVSAADTTVLLLGETGTGKELAARAIHARSARRDGPLVKVNCAAIPRGLVESELFGHERGAFTDAVARRHGKFELARRGTIFLDEIAELSLEVQAKLLRILQEREFERVGGSETLRADVRVVAASNRDLRTAVRAGEFREDLFFRLEVFPIRLPPLRDRVEDIPLLVDHFVRRLNARLGKSVVGLEPATIRELERYSWPGNVRELENRIERAMVLGGDDRLSLDPIEAPGREPDPAPSTGAVVRPLSEALRSAKITAIDRALARGGTQARAAELLGLKAPSLSRMLRDLGLRR